MNWNADYVLTVARDEKTADLDGWVTLVNNSGVAYHEREIAARRRRRSSHAAGDDAKRSPWSRKDGCGRGVAQFAQENFSEYHLYTLGRRTSIQNNESKQISLLTGTNIPVEKYLQVEGQQYYYRNPQGIGNAIPQPVKVFYRFKNDEKSGLGMPLPAGTVRVYQADSQGGGAICR